MTPYRHNNKWTINELLSLQREYQLLEMSIQEIANKHGRTVEAILFKLQSEQFIDRWIDATGYQEYSKTKSSLNKYLKDETNIICYNSDEELSSGYNLVSEMEMESDTDTSYNKPVETQLFNQQISNITSSILDIKSMLTSLVSKFHSSSNSTSTSEQIL